MFVALLISAVSAGSTAALASTAPTIAVDLLVADAAESSVDAAIRLRIEPPWHVYWQNPGDSGMAVRVQWTLPAGAHAEDLAWPLPTRFFDGTFATFGYEDEVVLTTRLHGVRTTDPISAVVSWLACDAICVPGKQHVVATASAEAATVIAQGRSLVPQPADSAQLQVTTVSHQDRLLTITLAGPAATQIHHVFPEAVAGLVIDYGSIAITDAIIRIPLSGTASALPLVLATAAGPRRLVLDLPGE